MYVLILVSQIQSQLYQLKLEQSLKVAFPTVLVWPVMLWLRTSVVKHCPTDPVQPGSKYTCFRIANKQFPSELLTVTNRPLSTASEITPSVLLLANIFTVKYKHTAVFIHKQ